MDGIVGKSSMDGDDDGVVPDQGKHTICVSPPRRSSGDVDDGFALGFLFLCSVVSRIMHHRYTIYVGRRKIMTSVHLER